METEFYNNHGCDFYYLFKINIEDENYDLYVAQKEYWLNWWGHTRINLLTGEKYPKGFIEMKCAEKMLEGV